MALYCQNMLEIASELAMTDPDYVDMSLKFVEHFLWIASSLGHLGDDTGMWDEEDGFFYDVLRLPDGRSQRLKVRSMVGLLPLCAATTFEGKLLRKYPEMGERLNWFLASRPELSQAIHDPAQPGYRGRRLGAILDEQRLRRVLTKMLDENEFLSEYGIRSLSRFHADHPYVMHVDGQEYRVTYLPAESDSGMFGGNSNWRGPIWMPVNGLIIRAAAPVFFILRRYLSDRMSHRLGTHDEPVRSGAGDQSAAVTDFPQGRTRQAARLRRFPKVPGGSPLAGLRPVLRIFPRRQWRRAGCQPSDRLDRDHRPVVTSVRHAPSQRHSQ
ncbi:MAG: hypothetical protein R3C12_18345 [Planctomycetaceae bacterium]